MDGDRITAIGKDLGAYDALDTGLFVCSPTLFDALDARDAGGDTTLSGGIRQLAAQRTDARRRMSAAPRGTTSTRWRISTTAEDRLAAQPRAGHGMSAEPRQPAASSVRSAGARSRSASLLFCGTLYYINFRLAAGTIRRLGLGAAARARSSAASGTWRGRGRGRGASRSRARSASRGSRACGSPPKRSATSRSRGIAGEPLKVVLLGDTRRRATGHRRGRARAHGVPDRHDGDRRDRIGSGDRGTAAHAHLVPRLPRLRDCSGRRHRLHDGGDRRTRHLLPGVAARGSIALLGTSLAEGRVSRVHRRGRAADARSRPRKSDAARGPADGDGGGVRCAWRSKRG